MCRHHTRAYTKASRAVRLRRVRGGWKVLSPSGTLTCVTYGEAHSAALSLRAQVALMMFSH